MVYEKGNRGPNVIDIEPEDRLEEEDIYSKEVEGER